jgi:hypothetical protein
MRRGIGVHSYDFLIVKQTPLGFAVVGPMYGDSATTRRHLKAAILALERAGYVALGEAAHDQRTHDTWRNYAHGR